MIFQECRIPGVFLIETEPILDERGFFARSFCQREFQARGLNPSVVQCNISYNKRRGTLRGIHYQSPPHSEAKLVRCARGAIYDVVIDLRPDSPTYCQWEAFELSARPGGPCQMLYIPEKLAHGFQTLEDDTEILYQMSQFYTPRSARGIRWDDPFFKLAWPIQQPILSAKDRSFPDFQPEAIAAQ